MLKLTTLIAVLFIGVASSAQGAVVINAVETGGDVVFTYSGTVDQRGWTLVPNSGDDFAFINPDRIVLVGPTPAVPSARFTSPTDFQGSDNFGTDNETFASSGSGGIFGLFFESIQLVVPGGYVRDTPISGTSTYSGQTFNDLGMEIGTYTWSWETSATTRDSVTLNVVPIPAAAWLFGSGLVALGAIARRRRMIA